MLSDTTPQTLYAFNQMEDILYYQIQSGSSVSWHILYVAE